MIKLVILDVDGVMTNGKKTYNADGQVTSKQFNDKDFTAIKQLIAAGTSVCFLSGDRTVNETVAKQRHIDFYHSLSEEGILNKEKWLSILLQKYGAKQDEVVYVGDDYFDLKIILNLTYTFCPLDSPEIIKFAVLEILNRNGGDGVVVSLVEYLLNKKLINQFCYDTVLEIDSREKK